MKQSIILFFLLTVLSCTQIKPSAEVREALKYSGKNKDELEKVIKHYSAPEDSLKLKSAIFLIKNMIGLYYYEGKKLAQYQNYVELINRDNEQGDYIMQSFNELYEPFSRNKLDTLYDLEHIKSEKLIENIDMAFQVWHEQPWGKNINFDQFLEYILPFRIADESPEYNRKQIYENFNPLLDSFRKNNDDAIAACIAINKQLEKRGWLFTTKLGILPHFPSSTLLKYRTGDCREMTDLATYVMRATGIPVATDMVQQWPYKSSGHMWNVVFNKTGKGIMFIGASQSPGTPHKPGTKKGKVYRRTYSINPRSLAILKGKNDIIPPFFADPRLKDVTDEYARCFNISLPIRFFQEENNKYAYLSVFNNSDWVPVHWSKIENQEVNFSKMEGDIVYLPCYYNPVEVIPANFPFILSKEGKMHELKPNCINTVEKMTLKEIFPLIPDNFIITNLFNGYFQGANKLDFSDAVDLYKVINPMPFENRVRIHDQRKLRFVRFKPASGLRCAISELGVYKSNSKLAGKLIGTKESYNESLQSLDKAADGDIATCFVAKFSTGSWIGFDLGKQQSIDEIRYVAPVNLKKDAKVVAGNQYELFYWNENRWLSVGKRLANGNTVIFKKIPSNALYMLKNLSHRNTEQRIFTYEKGKQVWW